MSAKLRAAPLIDTPLLPVPPPPLPVITGVLEERVVVTANFLIDAESNLKAALQTFIAEPKGGEVKP